MIADGANPAVVTDDRTGQQSGEVLPVPDFVGAHSDRVQGRGGGAQVHMVVVQPGNHGPTGGVVHHLATQGRQFACQLRDPLADTDIGPGAVEQHRPLDQHEAASRSATR